MSYQERLLNFKNILNEDIDLSKYLSEDKIARVATVKDFSIKLMDLISNKGEKGDALPWQSTHGKFLFRPQELTIWSGFKGHGKSLVISQMFETLLTSEKKVFIISPEFPPHRVLHRMLLQSIGRHNINHSNALDWLCAIENHIWLYDQQSSLTMLDVIALCRYAVEEHGVEHILIDSLMKCGIAPDDYGSQKKLVDHVQQIAHRNPVHIHLVAHARKGRDDGAVAGLHDIKGASEIADMAENIIIVWRNKQKEMGASGQIEAPDAIVKIEAQRNGDGWIGQVPLKFTKNNFSFQEWMA